MGKVVVILLLATAILGGVGIWYTQTWAFWAPVEGPVTLTLAEGQDLMMLPASDVSAIRSASSPLGFRACFTHGLDTGALADTLPAERREGVAPTVAPGWFDCFDAAAIGALLEEGGARAYTAYPNVAYGVDRIVALAPDGRGWAWHELNDCGDRAYDGSPLGPACPDRETFTPLVEGSL
ncbi:DUF6446 family protein [Jannaschia aquimarina]|uniref:Histidine kinase n=1 Tax=Jannaschia aquimarina TaxID=935700 RepID=A0A0D1CQZ2_9RHOB|nr:DUF6446 family protein [Jannaschia aquimarina]KIT17197.1 hypothetical protein jaqu_09280 [Jannaschia aquimarina]SNT18250.1 hypothetical protein SAMN05421775_10754 [Jannaschia aquimarina]